MEDKPYLYITKTRWPNLTCQRLGGAAFRQVLPTEATRWRRWIPAGIMEGKKTPQSSSRDDAYMRRRYRACQAVGGDLSRAGATGRPCRGCFSPLSFPLCWMPALTSPVAHTKIVFLLEAHTSVRHKGENRSCLHWVWAFGGFIFQ